MRIQPATIVPRPVEFRIPPIDPGSAMAWGELSTVPSAASTGARGGHAALSTNRSRARGPGRSHGHHHHDRRLPGKHRFDVFQPE